VQLDADRPRDGKRRQKHRAARRGSRCDEVVLTLVAKVLHYARLCPANPAI